MSQLNETISNLVSAIKDGDALGTEHAFADAMADKLADKLDTMRMEVAKNMFASPESVMEDEEISESVEQIDESLGKLAGQHYHHIVSAADAEEHGDDDAAEHHENKAHEIHQQVAKKHGEATAKSMANYNHMRDDSKHGGGGARSKSHTEHEFHKTLKDGGHHAEYKKHADKPMYESAELEKE